MTVVPAVGGTTLAERARFLGTDVAYALVACQDADLDGGWSARDRDAHVSVLRGSFTVMTRDVDGEYPTDVDAGQWVRVPAGVEHRISGRGLLEVFVPGGGSGDDDGT